jgi:hypothetical protein
MTLTYEKPENLSADHVSTFTASAIATQIETQLGNTTAKDGEQINKVTKLAGDQLYVYIQSNNTPMQKYLDDQNVDYRKFSSLDVNQSPDNIYYKNVSSNPEDKIDKMVLFNYGNKDAGENLFSVRDFNPNGVFDDEYINSHFSSINNILKIYLPSTAPDYGTDAYKEAIAKFKILAYGICTDSTDKFKQLSQGDFTTYSAYITKQNTEVVIDTGYKVSVS